MCRKGRAARTPVNAAMTAAASAQTIPIVLSMAAYPCRPMLTATMPSTAMSMPNTTRAFRRSMFRKKKRRKTTGRKSGVLLRMGTASGELSLERRG